MEFCNRVFTHFCCARILKFCILVCSRLYAKNRKLHTMVISLDIQGAFDHLQYNSIRNSLDEINFLSHTIETLKDILTDRKVTIQTAQGPVSWTQQHGCAQGSCTGPMFWNLVANEIISE
ncbi:hypothetical protein AVEN_180190-1 [Araneus ventricosus]|uniref:Reverse transcriptase domain-containing protein n=1 Tax=Araneus ventricosus TaxID=182803 RepID=A0A4Y2X8A1_ARAVE|nr:hypothetical protein AVEN_61176-1 [Araneus ventricosus]GBO44179.1 hypothetical protein AVEN_145302-1 [Araneus ventricosus]GBO44180.1 hypothetical protein AVEN_165536-1 [Araneus ventricosus]GBO44182.1 hypothetical protein AVEN_180190-1 [Araneus ventricosus]